MGSQGYLLLVEDDLRVQINNKRAFERRGYVLKQAYTLAGAREIIAEGLPYAIVLDVELPYGNGLDFLKELRKTSNIPVLMLTARGSMEDTLKGFDMGSDDYLPKPYELPLFLKRVEALLRRASIVPDTLEIGSIRLDTASGKAYLHGEDMGLSVKEYSLFQQFVQHPEMIVKADVLYRKVWGQEMLGDDTAIKVAISKLRTKLSGSGYTIVSSRGEGYCFESE